ncbi:uncharacterized protein ASPGLDRAFT_45544 [Aspergillus glaucus CBS 516.65]|uniref:F5/8 type C domain-containing protein n=1 Tax=Aspergillus glaucus CBS 516.65 TaxID=1160497 RepID=A0A1L9VNV5_ASPGL|nr:hypothetical protein ASPGLDRAFT_45544 [Aspergillus glaucus CBS 516.65]OJJ85560.1 hypothetical protein ASPGLDRAFT_45544 [Aspergillus glaucus CBS 516.65]
MKSSLIILALIQGILSLNTTTTSILTTHFHNDTPWYTPRIPLFTTSLPTFTEVYYYRWTLYRAHQRDLGPDGYITTEFLNDVSWQTQPYASLIDATGFHLREGRWCRDRRFNEDYVGFMLDGDRGNMYQFSEWVADSVWAGFLVDRDVNSIIAKLDRLADVFEGWEGNMTEAGTGGLDGEKGLFWIQPLTDATEYTIASVDASGGDDGFTGGDAFRPSVNSYQFANALAIARLAGLKGDHALEEEYRDRADAIKVNVQESLWNSTFEHFIDRFQVDNENVTYWDFIRGRELVGYVPWTHDLPDDNETFAQAWTHLLDSEKFAGSHGLRTNEPSYEYFMRQYRYEGSQRECQWNGPAWPYQITQVLTGLANLLDHYPASSGTGVVTRKDYTDLLVQYAQLHYNPDRGSVLDLEEDYDADTGRPIVGLARSPHYFHSGFIDLILSGFVGIRPRADDVLEVNPLADGDSVSFFRAENILYHGHDIAVQWDASGEQYGAAGLIVEIDGETAASAPDLTRLTVNITRNGPPAIQRPIAKSIQLQSDSEWPQGSVSVADADPDSVHAAIDGRVWFFPESDIANGWDTPVGNGSELWYQIEFGDSIDTASAEISFFANDTQGFDAPESYQVEVLDNGEWVEVSGAHYAEPVANGITLASWDEVTTESIRMVFVPKREQRVRLVEFKMFSEVVS